MICQAEKAFAQAQNYYAQAFALAENTGTPWVMAQIANNRGLLFRELGKLQSALTQLNKALDLLADNAAPHIQWRSYVGRGSVWQLLNEADKATADFTMALELVEQIRGDVQEESHRIGFFGDDPLFAYVSAIFHFLAEKRFDAAFDTVESVRSRAFLERLSRSLDVEPSSFAEVKQSLL